MKKISFIGIGLMGLPMAKKLLEAGYPLKAYNRTQAKAESLIKYNAQIVETINEVVIETRVAERYAVEMISCDSKDSLIVVYSYLVDSIDQSDIIPCRGREVERKCYSILFTILEGTDDGMLVKASSDQAAGGGDEKAIMRLMLC